MDIDEIYAFMAYIRAIRLQKQCVYVIMPESGTGNDSIFKEG
jgi:hypothetical protein